MKWYDCGNVASLKNGRIQQVLAGGKTVCVVFWKDEWFAFDARCPHAGGRLVNGWCEEKKVICPIHRYAFDLRTGRGDPGQNNGIRVYKIKEESERLLVLIKPSLWSKILLRL